MLGIARALVLLAVPLVAPAGATDFSAYTWKYPMDGGCAHLEGGNLVLGVFTASCPTSFDSAAMLAPLPGTFTMDLHYEIGPGQQDTSLDIDTASGGGQFGLGDTFGPPWCPGPPCSDDVTGISFDVVAGDVVTFTLQSTNYVVSTECTFSNLTFTPAAGVSVLGGSLDDGALFAFQPEPVPASFVEQVVSLGDVDGDGQGDFAYSIPGATAPAGTYAGEVVIVSGGTQQPLHVIWGAGAGFALGTSLAGVGDVDGDGVDDIAASEPGWPTPGFSSQKGRVRVLSGAAGTQLYTLDGSKAGAHFAYAVGGAGDADGDGRGDIVVSAPWDHGYAGGVFLYSGATHGLLYAVWGDAPGDFIGEHVGGAGDTNADGSADFFATSDNYPTYLLKGLLRIYSGKHGAVLQSFPGTTSGDPPAAAIGTGDLDGDGYGDMAVSSGMHTFQGGLSSTGIIRVRSGATGADLYAINGSDGQQLGLQLAAAGDLDGDGVDDFLATSNGATGTVTAFAGPSGAPLLELQNPDAWLYGHRIAAGNDLDADGTPDILVAARGFGMFPTADRIFGISGLHAAPSAPVLTASGALLAGSSLALELAGGPGGGDAFLVVGLNVLALPFKAGLLVPSPDLVLTLPLQADGSLSLVTTWPPGVVAPLAVLLQAWCPSPTAAHGFVASNSVMLAPP